MLDLLLLSIGFWESPALFLLASGFGICIYYLFFKPSRLTFVFNDNINNIKIINRSIQKDLDTEYAKRPIIKWFDFLLAKCPSLSGKRLYYPTPWMLNGHLQTLFTGMVNSRGKKMDYKRQIVPLEDGGQVALDWYPNIPTKNDTEVPIVLIIHGLAGNSQEGYCRATVNKLSEKDRFRLAVFNFRGCGGVEVTTPRAYSAGDTSDLKEVVSFIKNLVPETKLFAVGFSLGANLLVKYVGEESENCVLSGAISISNPFNFIDGYRSFKYDLIQKYIYDPVLASGLLDLLGQHSILKEKFIKRKWKSLAEYDHDIGRIMGGFKTINSYYRWASSDQYIPSVRVPLLILSSNDDPISQRISLPFQECKYNSYTLLATTEVGGHIGFWEGLIPRHWFPSLIQEYFTAVDHVLNNDIAPEFIKKQFDVISREHEYSSF